MMQDKFDITSGRDITQLVNAFYSRVRADRILGPIFDEVACVDWATHLPTMYNFWESVLFGRAGYKGDPLTMHRMLAQLTPLTDEVFDRWIALFHLTVDELFTGAMAREAKLRSSRIALVIRRHLEADSANGSPMLRMARPMLPVGNTDKQGARASANTAVAGEGPGPVPSHLESPESCYRG